jgi:hypothetical protein
MSKKKKSRLPWGVTIALTIFASHCPMCGSEAQDRRYKRMATGNVLTNRRYTNRTLTRECRVCGLRFSFTWKTFLNALRKKAKFEKDPKMARIGKERADFVEEFLDEYDLTTNTEKTTPNNM